MPSVMRVFIRGRKEEDRDTGEAVAEVEPCAYKPRDPENCPCWGRQGQTLPHTLGGNQPCGHPDLRLLDSRMVKG